VVVVSDLSDWLIDQAFLAGAPPSTAWTPIGKCSWCPHEWHGNVCSWSACTCEGSHTSQDDSWRPKLAGGRQDRMAEVMHDTGCDGWTASAATAGTQPPRFARLAAASVSSYLYGYPAARKAAA
jgi:hypothetical protein